MELYGFIHFTVNTCTGKEWGDGDESETVFNPTDFDAEQIVLAAKAGGLRCKPNRLRRKVRLRITKAAACPAISEVGLFLTPTPEN